MGMGLPLTKTQQFIAMLKDPLMVLIIIVVILSKIALIRAIVQMWRERHPKKELKGGKEKDANIKKRFC